MGFLNQELTLRRLSLLDGIWVACFDRRGLLLERFTYWDLRPRTGGSRTHAQAWPVQLYRLAAWFVSFLLKIVSYSLKIVPQLLQIVLQSFQIVPSSPWKILKSSQNGCRIVTLCNISLQVSYTVARPDAFANMVSPSLHAVTIFLVFLFISIIILRIFILAMQSCLFFLENYLNCFMYCFQII